MFGVVPRAHERLRVIVCVFCPNHRTACSTRQCIFFPFSCFLLLSSRTRPPRDLPPPDSPTNRSFFTLPPHVSFFPLLGIFSLNFGGVLEFLDPEMCTFGVKPGALGPPGLHTTARELQRAHFRAPALRTHHRNFTRTLPREGRKKEKCVGRGEKRAKFGPAPFGGPPVRGPPSGGSCF